MPVAPATNRDKTDFPLHPSSTPIVIDNIHTTLLPSAQPMEKRQKNVWYAETTDMPTTPREGHQVRRLPGHEIVPDMPLPSIASIADRRSANARRHALQHINIEAPGASISPELKRLIEHREQFAGEETRRLQALSVTPKADNEQTPPKSEGTAAAPPTPKPKAQTRPRRTAKRVPALLQMSMVECGAACLAMLLSYHGRKTTISEVREQCGIGRDGLSALSLVKAARKYGMRVTSHFVRRE